MENLNAHCCLMATVWLLSLQASCLCSRKEEGQRAKGQRTKRVKRPFPPQTPSLYLERNCPQGTPLLSLAGTGFYGHFELQERLGKSSFKSLLVSIIEEGRGDGTEIPFQFPIHSFGQRPAKAPGRGRLKGAEGQGVDRGGG